MKVKWPLMLLIIASLFLAQMLVAQLPKLPQPFASPSVRNSAQIVAKPESAQLLVPAGFEVNLNADNVQGPRTMVYAPNGDLFVAQPNAGSVLIVRDKNNDGTADERIV